MRKLVWLVIALSCPTTVMSQIQTRAWDDYCTTDAFQACGSVHLTLEQQNNQTLFTIAVRNLEGSLGDAGAWGLIQLGIYGLATTPPSAGIVPDFAVAQVDFQGTAGATGSSTSPNWSGLWGTSPQSLNPVFGGFLLRSVVPGDGGYAIAGCTPLSQNPNGWYFTEPGYLHTCGDGWVVFNMALSGAYALTDTMRVVLNSSNGQIGPAGVFGMNCTLDVDCQPFVTPEPATIALVATGMGGVAGWARRRRKTVAGV